MNSSFYIAILLLAFGFLIHAVLIEQNQRGVFLNGRKVANGNRHDVRVRGNGVYVDGKRALTIKRGEKVEYGDSETADGYDAIFTPYCNLTDGYIYDCGTKRKITAADQLLINDYKKKHFFTVPPVKPGYCLC